MRMSKPHLITQLGIFFLYFLHWISFLFYLSPTALYRPLPNPSIPSPMLPGPITAHRSQNEKISNQRRTEADNTFPITFLFHSIPFHLFLPPPHSLSFVPLPTYFLLNASNLFTFIDCLVLFIDQSVNILVHISLFRSVYASGFII